LSFCFLITVLKSQNCVPQAVRLSLGNYYFHVLQANTTELLQITFHTLGQCAYSYITIQDSTTNEIIQTISTNSTSMFNITDNSLGYLQIENIYIHEYSVFGVLNFNEQYNYTIYPNSSSSDQSRTFNFILPFRDTNKEKTETNIIFTGMMDISNQSAITQMYLNYFAQRVNTTSIDAIVYVGDMAFNLEDNLYQNGLNFFTSIENFTAYIPFMPTPGVRDDANNFEFYTKMISSPDDNLYNDFYYAFNLGYAHFVQINMAYYFTGTNNTLINNLYSWLEADLSDANKKVNRMARPWLIVYGYNSFYCSNTTDPFCGSHTGAAAGITALETLFYTYKVDLYISASNLPVYERLKPLYKEKAYGFSSNIPSDTLYQEMVNPLATIYLIDAAAGNYLFFNGETDLSQQLQNYDRGIYSLRVDQYQGIGIMTIKSPTVIEFLQLTTESYSMEYTDNFTLINTLTKWEDDWPLTDKITFISAAVVFTIIGGIILIIFMLSLE